MVADLLVLVVLLDLDAVAGDVLQSDVLVGDVVDEAVQPVSNVKEVSGKARLTPSRRRP